MARAEIEYPPVAALEREPAAEDLAPFEPGEEDYMGIAGDHEGFPVHLLDGEDEGFGDAPGDGMGRVNGPQSLPFGGLSPMEFAARAI